MMKILREVRNLPCPVCNEKNPVDRANVRIKCCNCGAKLLCVKVTKKHKSSKK